jgi:hypothetical protein
MATARDVSWEGPPGTFNLRVAAILTSGGDILLCTIRRAPAAGLGSLRFEPAGLATVLPNLDGALRHLVRYRREP